MLAETVIIHMLIKPPVLMGKGNRVMSARKPAIPNTIVRPAIQCNRIRFSIWLAAKSDASGSMTMTSVDSDLDEEKAVPYIDERITSEDAPYQ